MASGTAVYRPLTLQVSTACVKPGPGALIIVNITLPSHPRDAPSVNSECSVFGTGFFILLFVCFYILNPMCVSLLRVPAATCIISECPILVD